MKSDPVGALFAAHALLPGGWAADVLLRWDAAGTLTQVQAGSAPPDFGAADGVITAAGPVVPGLPNLHSHAFQRAFAGLTEHRSGGVDGGAVDTFWTWRTQMYRFALQISPDQLEVIATQLYIEMLGAGYTAVCEFHYLHHDPAGQPYAERAELALRLVRAARRAGIGLTLLPVLYQHSGFGGRPAQDEQRRFVDSVEGLLRVFQRLGQAALAAGPALALGVAPHSLRAVGPTAMAELLAGLDGAAPVHIHIAEQEAEVAACVAWSGARPVQWLLAHAPVDARWCLVHATHIDPSERTELASRGTVVGLCPTTEASLGDGVFDAPTYLDAGGAWGIGSDSHVSVDAAEELRLLEYTHRLQQRRRNVLASAGHPQVADRLWMGAQAGGAQACGRPIAGLAIGQQADFVVLQPQPGLSSSQALAHHIFAPHGRSGVRDVWVAGQQRIEGGRHALEGPALERFEAARQALIQAL